MTKRRKQYEEKRHAKSKEHGSLLTTSERSRMWSNEYRKFDKMISDDLRTWPPPKEKSWIEKCKESFLSKLNADVEKQYIKDFVSRSGTDER